MHNTAVIVLESNSLAQIVDRTVKIPIALFSSNDKQIHMHQNTPNRCFFFFRCSGIVNDSQQL